MARNAGHTLLFISIDYSFTLGYISILPALSTSFAFLRQHMNGEFVYQKTTNGFGIDVRLERAYSSNLTALLLRIVYSIGVGLHIKARF